MAVSDYNTTPASNTAISGINIDEGCPAANVNNGFRQMMADVRVMYDSMPSVAGLMPVAGGTFSGTQPIYTGRGAYLHHNGSSFASGRIFTQASGGSVPAGMLAGDLLLEY
jgi:hypothetical protein